MPDPVNVFQNTSLVTNEFLLQLTNRLPFIKGCNNDYASRFTETMKVGESIKIRKPSVVEARTGEKFTPKPLEDEFCEMKVQETAGADLQITNREQMFNFTSLRDQVIVPAAHTLACAIELRAMEMAVGATNHFVGVPGIVPTSLETYNDARAIMFDSCGPVETARLIITSSMGVKTNTAGQNLFNPGQIITDSFKKGYIGRHSMAEVYESQVVKYTTTGPYGGTPAVDGADQKGGTINTKNWTAAAANRLKKNDIISFANVYEVNRWTKQSNGRPFTAVVTADADSDSSGKCQVQFEPEMILTGPRQNVTGSPADGALISIYGKAQADHASIAGKVSPQGLRYARDAFMFASFDQPRGDGGVVSYMSTPDPESSVRVRFMKAFDIDGNVQKYRFDVVWAFGIGWRELACRVAS